MDEEIQELKSLVRSILLALGRRASEIEFLKEYYNTEGKSFAKVLQRFGLSFWMFMKRMPDVCRVMMIGDLIYIERVSTESSSHMDNLTIETKRKRIRPRNMFTAYRPLFPANRIRWGLPTYTIPNHFSRPAPFTASNHATSSHYPNRSIHNPPTVFSHHKIRAPVSQMQYQRSRETLAPRFNKSSIQSSRPSISALKTVVYKPQEDVEPDNQSLLKTSLFEKKIDELATSFSKLSTSSRSPLNQTITVSEMKTVVYKPLMTETNSDNKQIPSKFSQNESTISIPDATMKRKKIEKRKSRFRPLKTPLSPEEKGYNCLKAQNLIHQSSESSLNRESSSDGSSYSDSYSTILEMTSANPIRTSHKRYFHIIEQQKKIMEKVKMQHKAQNDKVVCSETVSQKEIDSNSLATRPLAKESETNTSQEAFREILPSSIAQPDREMHTFMRLRLCMDVEITNIISPSEFVFKFLSEEFEQLRDEMNICYNSWKFRKDLIPNEITKGSTLAAFHEENWYRVEIVNDWLSELEVSAYFIDLGLTLTVRTEDLLYLDKNFAEMSRRAAIGSLYESKPINGGLTWDDSAIDLFKRKVRECSRMCAIVKSKKGNTYELILIN